MSLFGLSEELDMYDVCSLGLPDAVSDGYNQLRGGKHLSAFKILITLVKSFVYMYDAKSSLSNLGLDNMHAAVDTLLQATL
jgi:hypothetical protein